MNGIGILGRSLQGIHKAQERQGKKSLALTLLFRFGTAIVSHQG